MCSGSIVQASPSWQLPLTTDPEPCLPRTGSWTAGWANPFSSSLATETVPKVNPHRKKHCHQMSPCQAALS